MIEDHGDVGLTPRVVGDACVDGVVEGIVCSSFCSFPRG